MYRHLAAAAIYVGLTIAITWPLAVHTGDRIPHDLGDPLLSIWTLWWNATVVPFTDRWWDGLAFFPARDTLTLSDHRVGLGIIATPLMWVGASPVTAHNVVYLATFILSALAAYALCFTLTANRGAAFVGGLVFGFNPFRAEHLPHLELLASYWLPVVFLALHRWALTPTWKWAALLSVALLMQALTSGYYFVFSGVLIGLWMLWFRPRADGARGYLKLGMAFAFPVLLIAPILARYHDAHVAMSLARSIHEIEALSADIAGLLTAPELLWLWNTPSSWRTPEGSLFPGLTAVGLIIVAIAFGRERWPTIAGTALRRARAGLAMVAACAGAVALLPALAGPVAYEFGGVRISVSSAYKPLSVCVFLLIGWALTSPRVRARWQERSPLAFYALATVAMWLFALGPTARLFGNRVLYKAPYSWLMLVPSVRDEFRAPARFAMLAVLTLSVAAALASHRLLRDRPPTWRATALASIALAVVLESWIAPFPLLPPPVALDIPAAVPSSAAVLELPSGVFENATAMYHSIQHRRPTLNGLSGYEPPHFRPMVSALEETRFEVLRQMTRGRDVAVFVRRDGMDERGFADLRRRTGGEHLATTESHYVTLVRQSPPSSFEMARGPLMPPAKVAVSANSGAAGSMLDGDLLTAWSTDSPQTGMEEIVADLSALFRVDGVQLTTLSSYFPRALIIDVRSSEQEAWTEVWRGDDLASLSLAAVLDQPPRINLFFSFEVRPARFIRLRQTGQSTEPLSILELKVQTDSGG
jgi:hypothetical protein